MLLKKIFELVKRFGKIAVYVFPVREAKTEKQKRVFQDLWHGIWLEEEFTTPEEQITKKYAKYDNHSTDLICYFLGLWPIGTMRVIWGNKGPLPMVSDYEYEKLWESENIVEFTLLTLRKSWRDLGLPSLMLMRAAFQLSREQEGIVIITERSLFYLLCRAVKLPFKKIGEQKWYEGGWCFPAYMDMQAGPEALRQKDPVLYKLMVL